MEDEDVTLAFEMNISGVYNKVFNTHARYFRLTSLSGGAFRWSYKNQGREPTGDLGWGSEKSGTFGPFWVKEQKFNLLAKGLEGPVTRILVELTNTQCSSINDCAIPNLDTTDLKILKAPFPH